MDEQDDKPLKVEGVDVVSLPFYKLSTKFGDLDQSKTWLLWCERGVMSRLQALYLREQGITNVKVDRPSFLCRVAAMSYPAYRFISAPTVLQCAPASSSAAA